MSFTGSHGSSAQSPRGAEGDVSEAQAVLAEIFLASAEVWRLTMTEIENARREEEAAEEAAAALLMTQMSRRSSAAPSPTPSAQQQESSAPVFRSTRRSSLSHTSRRRSSLSVEPSHLLLLSGDVSLRSSRSASPNGSDVDAPDGDKPRSSAAPPGGATTTTTRENSSRISRVVSQASLAMRGLGDSVVAGAASASEYRPQFRRKEIPTVTESALEQYAFHNEVQRRLHFGARDVLRELNVRQRGDTLSTSTGSAAGGGGATATGQAVESDWTNVAPVSASVGATGGSDGEVWTTAYHGELLSKARSIAETYVIHGAGTVLRRAAVKGASRTSATGTEGALAAKQRQGSGSFGADSRSGSQGALGTFRAFGNDTDNPTGSQTPPSQASGQTVSGVNGDGFEHGSRSRSPSAAPGVGVRMLVGMQDTRASSFVVLRRNRASCDDADETPINAICDSPAAEGAVGRGPTRSPQSRLPRLKTDSEDADDEPVGGTFGSGLSRFWDTAPHDGSGGRGGDRELQRGSDHELSMSSPPNWTYPSHIVFLNSSANHLIDLKEKVYVRIWSSSRQAKQFHRGAAAVTQAIHSLMLPKCFASLYSVVMQVNKCVVSVTWLPPIRSEEPLRVRDKTNKFNLLQFAMRCVEHTLAPHSAKRGFVASVGLRSFAVPQQGTEGGGGKNPSGVDGGADSSAGGRSSLLTAVEGIDGRYYFGLRFDSNVLQAQQLSSNRSSSSPPRSSSTLASSPSGSPRDDRRFESALWRLVDFRDMPLAAASPSSLPPTTTRNRNETDSPRARRELLTDSSRLPLWGTKRPSPSLDLFRGAVDDSSRGAGAGAGTGSAAPAFAEASLTMNASSPRFFSQLPPLPASFLEASFAVTKSMFVATSEELDALQRVYPRPIGTPSADIPAEVASYHSVLMYLSSSQFIRGALLGRNRLAQIPTAVANSIRFAESLTKEETQLALLLYFLCGELVPMSTVMQARKIAKKFANVSRLQQNVVEWEADAHAVEEVGMKFTLHLLECRGKLMLDMAEDWRAEAFHRRLSQEQQEKTPTDQSLTGSSRSAGTPLTSSLATSDRSVTNPAHESSGSKSTHKARSRSTDGALISNSSSEPMFEALTATTQNSVVVGLPPDRNHEGPPSSAHDLRSFQRPPALGKVSFARAQRQRYRHHQQQQQQQQQHRDGRIAQAPGHGSGGRRTSDAIVKLVERPSAALASVKTALSDIACTWGSAISSTLFRVAYAHSFSLFHQICVSVILPDHEHVDPSTAGADNLTTTEAQRSHDRDSHVGMMIARGVLVPLMLGVEATFRAGFQEVPDIHGLLHMDRFHQSDRVASSVKGSQINAFLREKIAGLTAKTAQECQGKPIVEFISLAGWMLSYLPLLLPERLVSVAKVCRLLRGESDELLRLLGKALAVVSASTFSVVDLRSSLVFQCIARSRHMMLTCRESDRGLLSRSLQPLDQDSTGVIQLLLEDLQKLTTGSYSVTKWTRPQLQALRTLRGILATSSTNTRRGNSVYSGMDEAASIDFRLLVDNVDDEEVLMDEHLKLPSVRGGRGSGDWHRSAVGTKLRSSSTRTPSPLFPRTTEVSFDSARESPSLPNAEAAGGLSSSSHVQLLSFKFLDEEGEEVAPRLPSSVEDQAATRASDGEGSLPAIGMQRSRSTNDAEDPSVPNRGGAEIVDVPWASSMSILSSGSVSLKRNMSEGPLNGLSSGESFGREPPPPPENRSSSHHLSVGGMTSGSRPTTPSAPFPSAGSGLGLRPNTPTLPRLPSHRSAKTVFLLGVDDDDGSSAAGRRGGSKSPSLLAQPLPQLPHVGSAALTPAPPRAGGGGGHSISRRSSLQYPMAGLTRDISSTPPGCDENDFWGGGGTQSTFTGVSSSLSILQLESNVRGPSMTSLVEEQVLLLAAQEDLQRSAFGDEEATAWAAVLTASRASLLRLSGLVAGCNTSSSDQDDGNVKLAFTSIRLGEDGLLGISCSVRPPLPLTSAAFLAAKPCKQDVVATAAAEAESRKVPSFSTERCDELLSLAANGADVHSVAAVTATEEDNDELQGTQLTSVEDIWADVLATVAEVETYERLGFRSLMERFVREVYRVALRALTAEINGR